MIDNSSIENLKQRLDIVDVVGHYLELKRSGASLKAVCPFHDDTSPSLHVSPSKQIYHCFSCGAGGDSIKFVMEYEKLSYPEAIEKLANIYNFSLSYTRGDNSFGEQKKILENLNLQFQKNLNHQERAKKYLHERGIFSSSKEKFEIGYALSSANTLSYLQNSGVTIAEAKEVGIADLGEDGRAYARFIERITFPIYSPNGRLVGFGGRTISNHPAKYVNSPQTKLFNKSKLLYGYHLARQSIFKEKAIIITEGYLDVIMLHQAGFLNSVATLGTALTKEHIPLISKGEPKVILSYDGDEAGVNAAFKASKMLSIHSIDGGVVLFNDGLDPADMVKNGKTQELAGYFRKPKPFVEFCIEYIVKSFDINDPMQKQKALNEASQYLKSLPNIIASSYQGILANMLHVKENLVHVNRQKSQKKENSPREFVDFQELGIIKTILQNPHLIDMVLDAVEPSMFKTHYSEFNLLLSNNIDNANLRKILLWEDVKIFDEENLREALLNLMRLHYIQELKKIKDKKNLDFTKKSFLIRKIQDKIFKLKKGEMVEYESFSSI